MARRVYDKWTVLYLFAALALAACGGEDGDSSGTDAGTDTDTDTDTDTETDAGTDTDTDAGTDTDTDAGTDTDTSECYPGSFTIDEVDTTGDLVEISPYTCIDGSLSILNTTLEIFALPNLQSVGGYVEIRGNSALTSLSGLSNLSSVGVGLIIGLCDMDTQDPPAVPGNAALTNLTGLENLTEVGGDVDVCRNQTLSDLTGLESLVEIGNTLWIGWNVQLTSLSALESLTTIGIDLWVHDDSSLPYCEVCDLTDTAIVSGMLVVTGNLDDACWTGSELSCP